MSDCNVFWRTDAQGFRMATGGFAPRLEKADTSAARHCVFAGDVRTTMDDELDFETPEEVRKSSVQLGDSECVFLFPSDAGLDFIFHFKDKDRIRLSFDWGRVADLQLRLQSFLIEAKTMQSMGLNPCNSEHRQSFTLSQLLALSEVTGVVD